MVWATSFCPVQTYINALSYGADTYGESHHVSQYNLVLVRQGRSYLAPEVSRNQQDSRAYTPLASPTPHICWLGLKLLRN